MVSLNDKIQSINVCIIFMEMKLYIRIKIEKTFIKGTRAIFSLFEQECK